MHTHQGCSYCNALGKLIRPQMRTLARLSGMPHSGFSIQFSVHMPRMPEMHMFVIEGCVCF